MKNKNEKAFSPVGSQRNDKSVHYNDCLAKCVLNSYDQIKNQTSYYGSKIKCYENALEIMSTQCVAIVG